jgi:hypothetical protein
LLPNCSYLYSQAAIRFWRVWHPSTARLCGYIPLQIISQLQQDEIYRILHQICVLKTWPVFFFCDSGVGGLDADILHDP